MSGTDMFYVNDVLLDLKDNTRYRILWISPDGEVCWWITLDGSRRTPDRMKVRELESWKESTRLVRTEDPVPAVSGLSPAQRERRDKKFAVISGAVAREPEIYDPHERAQILAEVSGQTGIKVQNLYSYLGRYWKKGKTADAFATPGDRRGKCRDYTKGGYSSLGRKRRDGEPGKNLAPEDFRHFSQAIRKYYLKESGLSLRETYDRMLQEHYTVFETLEDGSRRAHMRPPGELPSFMQLRYWYRKNKDVVAETKAREGKDGYERSSRSVTGYTERVYNYPGAAFQIDATIADIYLVKENDRNAIVGRPVMYFVMDAYTRMVTGMHITFRPPSWGDAVVALDNTLSDKTVYCDRFGISITPEEWPCMHLPTAIIADRGEMEARAADVLVSGLGIRIENTPPYRGDLKGIIEQHFRLVNLEMGDLMPGKVKKDFGQRGSRDYRLDAKLDIRQFTRIIIRCVLFHNNVHLMTGYKKEPQMRQMGVLPVPLSLWNFGIRYRSGGLMSADREKVRYTLLPKEEGSLTERGIAFRQLYYTCPEADREDWFAAARITGRKKVEVAYDPTSTAEIYLMHEDGRFLKCTRADLEGPGADTTFAEADADHQQDLNEQAAHKHTEMEKKAELGDFIDREIEAAIKMAESSPVLPKSRRLAEIGKNRQEAVREEKREAGSEREPGKEKNGDTGSVHEGTELNAVERLIRKQLEERLKEMGDTCDGHLS